MHVRSIAVSKRSKGLGRMDVMTRLRCCFVVFCTLLLTLSALAQVQNGQFSGTVTDPSGAAVPNAKVPITNQATNLSVAFIPIQTPSSTPIKLPVCPYKTTVDP